jgi:predicted transcriptional regulator of viral defense system
MIMKKDELARAVLVEKGGIAKTADFVAAGVSKPDLTGLYRLGVIERIRHGFYQRPGETNISEAQYLSVLLPEAIVSVESALFHYGYCDFTPRVWTLSVPRSISPAKLKFDVVSVKLFYVMQDIIAVGKTSDDFDGTKLSIYDRERTICDCFKYRSKLDGETFNKAVHAYVADDHKNLRNLSQYAKTLQVYSQVMRLMEVMLNG